MYKPFQYLFFKFYQWNKKFAPNSEQPVLNSILAVSLLMFCNLITFSLILELLSGFKIISFEGITVIKIVIIIGSILLANFFLLAFKSRYSSIIEYYSKIDKRTRNLGVVIYILLSIASLIFIILYIAGKASM
jgi:hypothetical protein